MLPYKCVEFQAFDDWRNVLKPIANDTLGDFSYNDIWNKTPYHAAEAINIKLRDTVIVDLKKPLKWHALYKVPFWCNIPSNSCETRTNTALAIMRSKGFAVSYDFVLQWPEIQPRYLRISSETLYLIKTSWLLPHKTVFVFSIRQQALANNSSKRRKKEEVLAW